MNEREKIIKIVKKCLIGILPMHMVDKITHKIADGLVLNGMKLEDGE